MLHPYHLLLSLLTLTSSQYAQVTFPIRSDPNYHLIPGDTLILQQLSSWRIQIGPISLNLGGELNRFGKRETSSREYGADRSWSRARRRGLWTSLGASLGLGGSKSNGQIVPGLSVGVTGEVDIQGWASAENVAKREKGDTEVDQALLSLLCDLMLRVRSGTPISPSDHRLSLYLYSLIPAHPTCSSSAIHALPVCLSNHSSYDPNTSSSSANLSSPWSIQYGDGCLSNMATVLALRDMSFPIL